MRETSLPQKTEHNELNRATEALKPAGIGTLAQTNSKF